MEVETVIRIPKIESLSTLADSSSTVDIMTGEE